jgi:hypothetical protein
MTDAGERFRTRCKEFSDLPHCNFWIETPRTARIFDPGSLLKSGGNPVISEG